MNRYIKIFIISIIISTLLYSNCVYAYPSSTGQSALNKSSEFLCPEFRTLVEPLALVANLLIEKTPDIQKLSIIRSAFAKLPGVGEAKSITVVFNKQREGSEVFIYDRKKIIHIYKRAITTFSESPIYNEKIGSISIDVYKLEPELQERIRGIEGAVILEAEQIIELSPEEIIRIIREHITDIAEDAGITREEARDKTLEQIVSLLTEDRVTAFGGYLNNLLDIAKKAGREKSPISSVGAGKPGGEKVSFIPVDLFLSILGGLLAGIIVWQFIAPIGFSDILTNNDFLGNLKVFFYLFISFISPWLTHEVLGHFLGGKIAVWFLEKQKQYPEVKLDLHWLWIEVVPKLKPESLSEEEKGQVKFTEKTIAVLGPSFNLITAVIAGWLLIFANGALYIHVLLWYIFISNMIAMVASLVSVGSIKLPLIGGIISHSRWKTRRQSDGGIVLDREILTKDLLEREIKKHLRYNLESDKLPSLTSNDLFASLCEDYNFLSWGKEQRDFFEETLDEMKGEVVMLDFTHSLVCADDIGILLDKEKIELLNHGLDGEKLADSGYFLSSKKQELVDEGKIIPVITYILKADLSRGGKARKKTPAREIRRVERGIRRIYYTKEGYKDLKGKVREISIGEKTLRISEKLYSSIKTDEPDLERIITYCVENNKLEEFLSMLDTIQIFYSLPNVLKGKKTFGDDIELIRKIFLWSLLPKEKRRDLPSELNSLINRLNQLKGLKYDVGDEIGFGLYFQFIDQIFEKEPQVAILLFCLRFREFLYTEISAGESKEKERENLHNEIILIFRPLIAKHFKVSFHLEAIDAVFKEAYPSIYERRKKERNDYLKDLIEALFNGFKEKPGGIEKLCALIKGRVISGLPSDISGRVDLDITGRPKGIWSIEDKLKRYSRKDEYKDREEPLCVADLPDVLAFRVVIKDKSGTKSLSGEEKKGVCYTIREILKGIPFITYDEKLTSDYIKKPKQPTGYQSLNTVWQCSGKKFEIQMRTQEMDKKAEHGPAVHWGYKVKESTGVDVASKGFMVIPCREVDEGPYKLVRLPENATFLDLLGHPYIDIIRKHVVEGIQLNTQLKPGDIVEFKLKGERGVDDLVAEDDARDSLVYRSKLFTKTLASQGEWKEGLEKVLQGIVIRSKKHDKLMRRIYEAQNINLKFIEDLKTIPYRKGISYNFLGLCRAAIDYGFTTLRVKREFKNGNVAPCLPAVEELLTAVYYGIIPVEEIIKSILPKPKDVPGHQEFESLRLKKRFFNEEITYNVDGERVISGTDNIRDYLFSNGQEYKNWQEGLDLYIDRRIAEEGLSSEVLLSLTESLSEIEEQYRGNIGYVTGGRRRLTIGIVDTSPTLFVDCTRNGFIGINKIFFDIFRNDTSPEKIASRILLYVGLHHELYHEGGYNSEESLLEKGLDLCLKLVDRYASAGYSKINIICELNRLLIDVVEEDSIFIRKMTVEHIAGLLISGDIPQKDILVDKLRRILTRLKEGKRIEITERQVNRLLWLIDKSRDVGLVKEIADVVDIILKPSGYIGDAGELVMTLEAAILPFVIMKEQMEKVKDRVRKIIKDEKRNVLKSVQKTVRGLSFRGLKPSENVKKAMNYAYYKFEAPAPESARMGVRYVLIDEYRAERYGELIKEVERNWNVRFIKDVTEIEEGERHGIIALVDPEDIGDNKWRGDTFKYYLPLPYMKLSFTLAAELATTDVGLEETRTYQFVSNFYRCWLGEGACKDIESWFSNPLLLRDRIESKLKELQFIRIAAEQLDTSA